MILLPLSKTLTDTLSMVIYQVLQLENHENIHEVDRIHAKAYARYLLSLNLIDELGFNTYELSLSSPARSHLVYFMDLLKLLKVNPLDQKQVVTEAYDLNQFNHPHLPSYNNLLLILAKTANSGLGRQPTQLAAFYETFNLMSWFPES